MSVSEYTQLMKEAGIASFGTGSSGSSVIDNKIQVEHILIFDVSERWEKVCKGTILALLDVGKEVVGTFRIVAVAGSICMLLWGCSNLIESIRGKRLSQDSKH